MMVAIEPDWRELRRCESLHETRCLATSIAAMEFDVRITDARGWSVSSLADEDVTADGPYLIMVRAEDLPDLREVVDEILEEQAEFDAALEWRRYRVGFWQRAALAAGGLAVVSYAAHHLLQRLESQG